MRRTAISIAILATLVAVGPVPAAAQRAGTVQLGLAAQRTAFAEATTLAYGTAPGLGALAGIFVYPNLSIEGILARSSTQLAAFATTGVSWTALRARAVYHAPVTENFYPILGVGLVSNHYGRGLDESDHGFSALAGFTTYVREGWAFRSDVSIDQVSTAFNEGDVVAGAAVTRHVNWTLTAGMSVDIGPGRFRDSDGDLVRDRLDLCPGTPLGVTVDTDGCRVDSDRDGVWDEDDVCAETPRGVLVDRVGCRVDSDNDGVFEENDRCPGTAPGVGVDGSGCEIDADLDRVPDSRDLCPGTPAGARVDGNGCRVDTDRDGVFDEIDQCPATPAGSAVDAAGCPALFVETQSVVVLEGVTFETASAELTPEARSILDLVAASLVRSPDIRVRVNGHTDSVGSRASNLILSENRAASVVQYLTSRGVDATRLESQGFGPDQPVASNDTPEGRQQNRRVELERLN